MTPKANPENKPRKKLTLSCFFTPFHISLSPKIPNAKFLTLILEDYNPTFPEIAEILLEIQIN